MRISRLVSIFTLLLLVFAAGSLSASPPSTLEALEASANNASISPLKDLLSDIEWSGSNDLYTASTRALGGTVELKAFDAPNVGWLIIAEMSSMNLSSFESSLSVALSGVTMIYRPEGTSTERLSDWPNSVKSNLRANRLNRIKISRGVNLFAGIPSSGNSLLSGMGMNFDALLMEAHFSSLPATYDIKMTGEWDRPFGIRNSSMSDVGIQLTIDSATRRETVSVSGNFNLSGKSYFMAAAQNNAGKRGFGFAAESLTLEDIAKLATSLPLATSFNFGRMIDDLPLDQIRINNDGYQSSSQAIPPNSNFMLKLIDRDIRIAGTRGPYYEASGSATALGQSIASLDVTIDPSKRKLTAAGDISLPEIGGLSFGSARFTAKSTPSMKISGELEVEGMKLAGTAIEVGRNNMTFEADLGCMPPMMIFSLDVDGHDLGDMSNADFSTAGSSCGKQIKETLKNVAGEAWGATSDAVVAAYEAIAGIFAKEDPPADRVVSLYDLYARQLLYEGMVQDWPAEPEDYRISMLTGEALPEELPAIIRNLPGISADKADVQLMLDEDIPCLGDGRLIRIMDAIATLKLTKTACFGAASCERDINARISELGHEKNFNDDWQDRAEDLGYETSEIAAQCTMFGLRTEGAKATSTECRNYGLAYPYSLPGGCGVPGF